MMARGAKFCLARVVESATIAEVKLMLSGYMGVLGQDSNTIWLHTGGDRQFCMQHQRRLSKKDIEHLNRLCPTSIYPKQGIDQATLQDPPRRSSGSVRAGPASRTNPDVGHPCRNLH